MLPRFSSTINATRSGRDAHESSSLSINRGRWLDRSLPVSPSDREPSNLLDPEVLPQSREPEGTKSREVASFSGWMRQNFRIFVSQHHFSLSSKALCCHKLQVTFCTVKFCQARLTPGTRGQPGPAGGQEALQPLPERPQRRVQGLTLCSRSFWASLWPSPPPPWTTTSLQRRAQT